MPHADWKISGEPERLGCYATGRELVKRANLQPQPVDEYIMGNVVSAGFGQNPDREAELFGGLAPEVGAMTINKVCGSGLKAVALAARALVAPIYEMIRRDVLRGIAALCLGSENAVAMAVKREGTLIKCPRKNSNHRGGSARSLS